MKADHGDEGMSVIVQTVARWLKGLILIYGICIVLYGHITPGGGFAGGVIIACVFTLLTLAGGQRQGLSFFSKAAASTFDSIGLLMFLAIAWLGTWWVGGFFFRNFISTPEQAHFTLFSGGTIPMSNIGLGLKVASSIFLVFTVLAAFEIVRGDGEGEETEES
jgi:multicomponent Na+:H+ antiporter subunit B